MALAEPRGMRPLIAYCHLGLGKLYRRTGKRQEARPLAKATSRRRSRTSERERTTRGSV